MGYRKGDRVWLQDQDGNLQVRIVERTGRGYMVERDGHTVWVHAFDIIGGVVKGDVRAPRRNHAYQ